MTKMTGKSQKCPLAVLRADPEMSFEIDFEAHFEGGFGKKVLAWIFHYQTLTQDWRGQLNLSI
jgi:hypothetical protein